MKNSDRKIQVVLAVTALLTLCAVEQARAGFYTWASLTNAVADTRVRNATSTVSNRFVTTTVKAPLYPSSGFNTNTPLTVSGTWSVNLTSRGVSKVGARGLITNKGTPVNGDAIDSGDPSLDGLVTPTSACPTIELSSEPVDVLDEQNSIDPNAFRYVLNIFGSDAGTALKVIWYDWLIEDGDPVDTEDLIANGRKLAEFTFVGPVNLVNYDCIIVRSTRGREFIHVVTAGTAASLPFNITCPGPIVVGCGGTVQYPDVEDLNITGGVAPYTLTFDPPIDQLPNAVSNTVTVTATDANGCTAPCQFFVIRNATVTFAGFDAPISGEGGTCAVPLRTVKRGSNIPVKFSVTCNGAPVSTPPHVEVKNCATGEVLVSGDAIHDTPAVWHFNVDTSLAKFVNLTLQIEVNLPGGVIKKAVIKLKN